MNQVSEQLPGRRDLEKVEKIKLIAYQLWLARRDNNVSGDAESDYYQAEHILESRRRMKTCQWVEPVLVAQVKFTEWTSDHQLRQPVFLGLRTDKLAKDVVRE